MVTIEARRNNEARYARQWEPRPSRAYRVFRAANVAVLLAIVVVTLYPFVNILARSFSGEKPIRSGQVNLWPRGFNLTTYQHGHGPTGDAEALIGRVVGSVMQDVLADRHLARRIPDRNVCIRADRDPVRRSVPRRD